MDTEVTTDEPTYTVVKRALVSLKIAKPEDMSDQNFEEHCDRLYVEFSEIVDARFIESVLTRLISSYADGVLGTETAVEVL